MRDSSLINAIDISQLAESFHGRRGQKGVNQSQGGVNLEVYDQVMNHGRTDASNQVVAKETPLSPCVFDRCAEHPEGEHIEEQVAEITMHEHISDNLPDMEVGGGKIMQAEDSVQVELAGQHNFRQKEQAIDYQQVFNHRRQDIETSRPYFVAHIFVFK